MQSKCKEEQKLEMKEKKETTKKKFAKIYFFLDNTL